MTIYNYSVRFGVIGGEHSAEHQAHTLGKAVKLACDLVKVLGNDATFEACEPKGWYIGRRGASFTREEHRTHSHFIEINKIATDRVQLPRRAR